MNIETVPTGSDLEALRRYAYVVAVRLAGRNFADDISQDAILYLLNKQVVLANTKETRKLVAFEVRKQIQNCMAKTSTSCRTRGG